VPSHDDIHRVRRKIESGEPLEPSELELLERAAQRESGPTLKVAVAQALLNGDDTGHALRLLETLRRDHPHDVAVMMAHARALIGIERYPEAERTLQEARARQPKDPEVLKALAALALRRGEIERAHRWIDEVLAIDPVDEEAQLLKSELTSSDLPAPAASSGDKVSSAEFITALTRRLDQQSTPHLVQKDDLIVRLGQGQVARLDLRSLYASYLEEGTLSDAVDAIARELAEGALGVPEGPDAVLAKVLPVLRDETFLERALGAARREGPAGLWIFYVMQDAEMMRYLPEAALRTRKISNEALDLSAFDNLGRHLAAPRPVRVKSGAFALSREETGLWALCVGDGHDPARLLVPAQQRTLRGRLGPGPYRAYLGRRELAVLCRNSDAKACLQLQALQAAADGIAGSFVIDEAGRLTRLAP
jgi:tetratricopeptide (TPR) repeat protein